MADRMRRTWLPFTSGSAPIALPGSAVSRVLLPTILENVLGRLLQGYTVTRTIFSLELLGISSGRQVVSVGIIALNSQQAIGTLDPASQKEADWQYLEELVTSTDTGSATYRTVRDIAGQRKLRGRDQELYFYVYNKGAQSVEYHLSGRTLILSD